MSTFKFRILPIYNHADELNEFYSFLLMLLEWKLLHSGLASTTDSLLLNSPVLKNLEYEFKISIFDKEYYWF